MTTHLVIADVDTLTRLLRAAKKSLDIDLYAAATLGSWLPWRHKDTGDEWHFRPDHVASLPAADLYYVQGGSFGLPLDVDRILPLIAACDLLGVDEL